MTWVVPPKEFKPVFYRKYVDDIFVPLEPAEDLSKFCDYFNTGKQNMSFSFEQEKNWKVVISCRRNLSRKRAICINCLK